MNGVVVEPEPWETILSEGRTAYPEEACGFLLGPSSRGPEDLRWVTRARPVANQSREERGRRFVIPPSTVHRVEEEEEGRGNVVVGFYHSHPDYPARPSSFDEDHAWPWYTYIVVSVENGRPARIGAYELDAETGRFGAMKLRPPNHGSLSLQIEGR